MGSQRVRHDSTFPFTAWFFILNSSSLSVFFPLWLWFEPLLQSWTQILNRDPAVRKILVQTRLPRLDFLSSPLHWTSNPCSAAFSQMSNKYLLLNLSLTNAFNSLCSPVSPVVFSSLVNSNSILLGTGAQIPGAIPGFYFSITFQNNPSERPSHIHRSFKTYTDPPPWSKLPLLGGRATIAAVFADCKHPTLPNGPLYSYHWPPLSTLNARVTLPLKTLQHFPWTQSKSKRPYKLLAEDPTRFASLPAVPETTYQASFLSGLCPCWSPFLECLSSRTPEAGFLTSLCLYSSSTWRRNGNPLQDSCLENSMNRGDRRATAHGPAKSWTRLSNFDFTSSSSTWSENPSFPILLKRAALYAWQFLLILFFSIATITSLHIILLLFSCSVMSDSLWPRGMQHARLPCPSPSPRACSNSCPSSQWYHPTISSSVIPFSFCFQPVPASGSFQMSQLLESGGQSIGGSALTSVLPMNIQDWFPWGLTGLISLQSKGLSRVFSSTTVQKHQFFGTQLSL